MNIQEYAVFLGVDDDGYPTLVDAREKKGFLFVGNADFDYIKNKTHELGSRVEFVTITQNDLLCDSGWQKIFALGAWIRADRAENHVLIIESLGETSFLSMTNKRYLVQLFDRITILAKATGKSILAHLFEENVIKIGAKYLYEEQGEQRWFTQPRNFTPDKILEISNE